MTHCSSSDAFHSAGGLTGLSIYHEYGSGPSSCGSPMTARRHGSSSSKINHSGCATNRATIQRTDLLPACRGVVVTSTQKRSTK